MTRWIVVGGGTAGCVVAANLAHGSPDDEIVILESGPELGGASLVNGGVVVGDPSGYRHRLPLEPPVAPGVLGAALLDADASAAPVLLARRAGRRVSAAEAYLEPRPPNVVVTTGVAVAEVALDRRAAVGVRSSAGDVAADRVVVCAGAVGTPALLLRSGADTGGVGLGLQDHVGAALIAGGVSGPVVTSPEQPDVTVTAEHGDSHVWAIEPNVLMDGYGALVAGWLAVRSTGSVRLADDSDEPAVDSRRLHHPHDRAGLVAAVQALVQLASADRLRAAVGEWFVDAHGTTLAELLAGGGAALAAWAEAAPSPYHHLSGSCRLGIVTDPGGWVRGYSGLALADASVLPGVPRRNPYLAVIDLAERLSSGWAARSGG